MKKEMAISTLLARYQNGGSSRISENEIQQYINSVSFLQDTLNFGKTATLIVEYETMQYLFCSANTKEVIGVPPEVLMRGGPAFTLSLADSEHLAAYNEFLPETLKFFRSLPAEERSRHKFSFTISLSRMNGDKTTFLQHNYFSKWSSDGKPLAKLITLTDISDYKQTDAFVFFISRHNDNGKNEIIKLRKYLSGTQVQFSKREIDVLEQFSSGLITRQIAESLMISENTVRNHKKRIMKKMGCNNMAQAVSLASLCEFLSHKR